MCVHRADATVLRFLPGFVKNPLKKSVSTAVGLGQKGLSATAGKVTNVLTSRCAVLHLCCFATSAGVCWVALPLLAPPLLWDSTGALSLATSLLDSPGCLTLLLNLLPYLGL
jgi:hypothetical protein